MAEFDPDKYLQEPFDPDAYLGEKPAPAKAEKQLMPMDEMSMRFGEAAQPEQATMPYQKQMGRVGQVARGFGRGAAAGVPGLPGDIESLGRSAINLSRLKVSPETYLPTSQELAARMPGAPSPDSPRYKAEQIGVTGGTAMAPIGTAGKAVSMLVRPSKFERLLSELTARGGKLGEEAKVRAGETLAQAQAREASELARVEGERIKRETAIGKLERRPEKQPAEVAQIETASRTEAGLPQPETVNVIAAQQDVNSQLRTLAKQGLEAAQQQQATVGGQAFQRYRQVAETKQQTLPFGTSKEGKALLTELDNIIGGGTGKLREFGEAEISIAKKIRNELFGRRAEDISEADVLARAAQNQNRAMSQAAKMAQARKELEAAEAAGRKPVDFQIVDNLLRELRQTQASKVPEAATAIARQRYKSAADKIEESLKKWVGEENYPREAYAKASEDLNKFRTKLGEALTAVEEIPYAVEGGVATTRQSRLAPVVFESRESVGFARQLLGSQNVDKLGTQFAINQLAGKDAAGVEKWLKQASNEFVYEIPGLHEKLVKYGQSLARREGDNKAMAALQKQLEKSRTEVRKVAETGKEAVAKEAATAAKTYEQTIADVDRFTRTLALEDPAKLSAKFADLRPTLEKSGVFKIGELETFERELARVSRIASEAERRQEIGIFAGKLLKKILTLGLGR
jgi:hypothetical protein